MDLTWGPRIGNEKTSKILSGNLKGVDHFTSLIELSWFFLTRGYSFFSLTVI